MDAIVWVQLGVLAIGLATGAGAIVKAINSRVDARADKMDLQFGKIDLKFDAVTSQIDRLRDVGNERHITNIERMARLEGHLSALKVGVVETVPKKEIG